MYFNDVFLLGLATTAEKQNMCGEPQSKVLHTCVRLTECSLSTIPAPRLCQMRHATRWPCLRNPPIPDAPLS